MASKYWLTYDDVKLVFWLVHCVETVHQVHWKHAEMFVEKLYSALVDAYCLFQLM